MPVDSPIGAVSQGAPGSSTSPWPVLVVNQSTGGGAGSTVVDIFSMPAVQVSNPTTAVSITNPTTAVTVSNPTTSVSLSSQITMTVGNPTTAVNVVNPSTAFTLTNPTTLVTVSNPTTSVNVANPTTAVTASQGAGSSSVEPWLVDSFRFSSAQTSPTTIATSAEGQILAANAARRSAVISNLSSAVELLVGFTTAVVSTAKANCHYIIPPNGKLTIGGQLGDVPLYTGPIRGRLNSTTLTGLAGVLQFTT